jgi:hypothetical protein
MSPDEPTPRKPCEDADWTEADVVEFVAVKAPESDKDQQEPRRGRHHVLSKAVILY